MSAHSTTRTNSDAYWAKIADWIGEYKPMTWRPRHRYRDEDWGALQEICLTRDADILSRVVEIKRRHIRRGQMVAAHSPSDGGGL